MSKNLPAEPSPFPTLKEGLAIGANDHKGFVNVFNWLAGIVRKASEYFMLGLNGRTGKVNLVAGNGIKVTANGQTITISTGSGENVDEDAGDGNGGGAGEPDGGGGNGGGRGRGGSGDGDEAGDWTDAEPSGGGPRGDGVSNCNGWSDEAPDNSDSSDGANEGDNCNELNGW